MQQELLRHCGEVSEIHKPVAPIVGRAVADELFQAIRQNLAHNSTTGTSRFSCLQIGSEPHGKLCKVCEEHGNVLQPHRLARLTWCGTRGEVIFVDAADAVLLPRLKQQALYYASRPSFPCPQLVE